MSHDRRYPIPAPAEDARFTFGLVLDLADVLHRHGYPKITSGDDFVELQQAVWRFLYTTDTATAVPETAADRPGVDPASEEC
ncbi:hypothetical protein OHS58_48520 [Amycolatopsis sp. NBC_00348]|uniref:hypothetical protein n=1 Tax=unclassified Amycolatopsis TaxID=2618356 RepID=UPI002E258064|nr:MULTISPECIES: hypothetical protein [unclassified Amycolatopsis]